MHGDLKRKWPHQVARLFGKPENAQAFAERFGGELRDFLTSPGRRRRSPLSRAMVQWRRSRSCVRHLDLVISKSIVVSTRDARARWATPMKPGVSSSLLIIAAAIWLAFFSVTALADRRVALVIGNSSYQNVDRLPNPAKDAEAIAQMFRKAGFDAVQLHTDLGYLDFKRALRRFEDASATADIAVIFYAGHGIELNGTNYMLPIDAKLAVDRDARDEAVELGRLIEAVESSKRLSLVILDACRDNPFLNTMKRQRRVARGGGLADPTGEMRKDMLVAYAAKQGASADDGNGEHSPFTTAILHNLTEPGLDIRLAFGRIRDEVLEATNNQQEPYVYTSMGADSISLVPAIAHPKPTSEDEIRGDYNAVTKAFEAVHTRGPLDVFLKKYPAGFYTELVREQLKKFENDEKLASRESESRPPSKFTGSDILTKSDLAKRDPASTNAAMSQEQICKHDQERLARLRVSQAPDEVIRFERELRCERLRVQLLRLLDSVSPEWKRSEHEALQPLHEPGPKDDAASQKPEGDTSAEVAPGFVPQEQICKHDQERLARLRVSQVPDEVIRFERELRCERLRAQLLRLLDSVSPDRKRSEHEALQPLHEPRPKDDAAPQKPEGDTSAEVAPGFVPQEQICKHDQERLARLRVSQVPDEVIRFEHELGCERLRPQVTRLRESLDVN
jgi:hypothetical protein